MVARLLCALARALRGTQKLLADFCCLSARVRGAQLYFGSAANGGLRDVALSKSEDI